MDQWNIKQQKLELRFILAQSKLNKSLMILKLIFWGIGWCLYHISKFSPPFYGENLISLGNNIVNLTPERIPRVYYSDKLNDFVFSLLNKSKSERPSALETLLFFPDEIIKSYTTDLTKQLCSLEEDAIGSKDIKIITTYDHDDDAIEFNKFSPSNILSPK